MSDQINHPTPVDATQEESPIIQIFKRIVEDPEFKQRMVDNKQEAVKEYSLSEVQMIMIENLSEDDIQRLTPENLEEFFAADAAVYTPDEDEVMDDDAYSAEDFEGIEDFEEDED